MYRDESKTLLDVIHSHKVTSTHNFDTVFLRNLRCSAVMSTVVGACRLLKID